MRSRNSVDLDAGRPLKARSSMKFIDGLKELKV